MRYKGKYSLKENLIKGRGMRLIKEMRIGKDKMGPLVQRILDARNLSGNARKKAAGDAAEELIMQHLGNAQQLNAAPFGNNFPFADVMVGNPQELSQSDNGDPGSAIYYSVKACTQDGTFDAKQKLNPDDFCARMEDAGFVRPDQQVVTFKWAMYALTIDYDGDAVQIYKTPPVTVACYRDPEDTTGGMGAGWKAGGASKRPEVTGMTLANETWDGNTQLRSISQLESEIGVSVQLVGDGAYSPDSSGKVDPAYDEGGPGGYRSRDPGFRGTDV